MGPKKKFGPKKKNGPKRPTNLAETTQLQNWAETTQAETTRPKRLRTETTQGPKRFRAETSRDLACLFTLLIITLTKIRLRDKNCHLCHEESRSDKKRQEHILMLFYHRNIIF